MRGYAVFDADGHCVERDVELARFVQWQGRTLAGATGVGAMPLFPSLDGWFRAASDKLAPGGPEGWLAFLESTGIATTVLHPTSGLAYGLIQDAEWAVALGRAYNDWLHATYLCRDPRFRGMALIPIHRPTKAADELRRAVRELGMLGACLPARITLGKSYGHADFDPIWQAARELGCAITFHGAPSRGLGFDHFDKFIQTHTLEHPFAILIQFTSMMFDGVFQRFPDVHFGFLEAGAGWVPYMMDRMDEEWERRGRRWCPQLELPPSQMIAQAQVYVSAELEERTLPFVAHCLGSDRILFGIGLPARADPEEFLADLPGFDAREDVDDALRRAILHDNPLRFYGLTGEDLPGCTIAD